MNSKWPKVSATGMRRRVAEVKLGNATASPAKDFIAELRTRQIKRVSQVDAGVGARVA